MCVVLTNIRFIKYKLSACIKVEASMGGYEKTWDLKCFNDEDFPVPHNESKMNTKQMVMTMLKIIDGNKELSPHSKDLTATFEEIKQFSQPVLGWWFPPITSTPRKLVEGDEFYVSNLFWWLFSF